jgi:Tfp pilus assembly protein PilO
MTRILPLIAIFLAIALAFSYIEPTYSGTIADKRASIARSDQVLAAAAAFQEKEDALNAAKNEIPEADLARLETLLPRSVDNVALILDLTALAARSGVTLSDINVLPVSETAEGQGTLGTVDLNLTAAGSYSAFRNFLKGIEKSARILDVVRLVVNNSETGVYRYTVSLRLYWLR